MQNCEHQGEGWCLSCVAKLAEERNRLRHELGDEKKLTDALTEHRNQLVKDLVEERARLDVKELHIVPGEANITWSGKGQELVNYLLALPFLEGLALNYVEWITKHEKFGTLVARIQRLEGITPHDARKQAEAERDRLYRLLCDISGTARYTEDARDFVLWVQTVTSEFSESK